MDNSKTILIVEDEQIIAGRIERLGREILRSKHVRFIHRSDREEAKALLEQQEIQLLLLDLNLEGRDGFELLKNVAAASFSTIIISAHDDQAIRAYQHGVIDFVAKPFTRERLALALRRWLDRGYRPEVPAKYLSIQHRGVVRLAEVTSIDFIKGADVYAEVHLSGGERFLHSKTLDQLHQLLPPDFERIHRSIILNMRRLLRIHIKAGGRYEAELKDGRRLPVSRSRYKVLQEQWL